MRYHYPAMKNSNKWPKPLGGPPKKLLDEDDGRPDAPVYGPLFPRPVFVGLLVVFCASLMLTADWFGLLLLNPRVSDRIGPLNTVRVMAVLMTGIAVPSALLMPPYKRLPAAGFGLLLLNPRVSDRIGPLNTVRVMAVLMTGIAVPSALLMLHYKRLYSYVSEHTVCFAIPFSLSFMLGLPCALVGVFG